MAAFQRAVDVWAADMIELDVRATADGHCVVLHDATVDRTSDGSGEVARMPLAELRELDFGYRFTQDDGRSHPFRGRRVSISTIDEVLEALPRTRLTIEVKVNAAQQPLFAAIARFNAVDRVVAAGMYEKDRTLFRTYAGAISASREQLLPFYVLHRARLAALARFPAHVVQVPERTGRMRLVTPRFVRELRARGVPVHVWTINDERDMHRLLDWGVDGIMSDRPDLLGRVLQQRAGRAPAPGHQSAV